MPAPPPRVRPLPPPSVEAAQFMQAVQREFADKPDRVDEFLAIMHDYYYMRSVTVTLFQLNDRWSSTPTNLLLIYFFFGVPFVAESRCPAWSNACRSCSKGSLTSSVASTPYCQGATLLGMTRREEDEQVMPRHGCVLYPITWWICVLPRVTGWTVHVCLLVVLE